MRKLSNSSVVERVKIDALRLPQGALLVHPKKQIEKTQKFLAAFTQVPVVYAERNGDIIFGEEIWLALKASGYPEVNVIFVDGTPVEIKAMRLALHRLPRDAKWNIKNVVTVIQELASNKFDLDLTGFDAPEIDTYLNLDLPKANQGTGADIPAPGSIPVTQRGCIWKLGRHRIGCGDATDLAFVSAVLENEPAHVCFVDPPYNISVNGFISGKATPHHREFLQGAVELSSDDYFAFLCGTLSVLKRNCAPTALLYACIDWPHVMEMTVAGHACDMQLYQIVTLVKSNGGMGGIYRNLSEFICVFKASDADTIVNVKPGRHGRTNVWSYPDSSSSETERDSPLGMQSTVKPVVMIADAIRDVTKRGEIVLDTFLGSGSTLMAAEETGRCCRGVDLDPRYVDIVVRRWQTLTGRDAVLSCTGQTFKVVAESRASLIGGSMNG